MKNWKKIVLYITGPGALLFLLLVLFIHLFTTIDARSWIIGGLIPFFVLFLPLYMVEYFRDETRKEKQDKKFQFNKRNSRIEWEGGNIHGKTPTRTERAGRFFNRK